MVKGNL